LTWDNIRTVDSRQFVFIRATRGGTTGQDNRQGGYPSNNNTTFNLSQRYDDPYFVQNVNRSTTAGLYAGSYHFARPDIVTTTANAGGIANTAIDEANHMIQMAGAFMRPGYLPPVFDLEAGEGIRTDNELAQYSIDFSNRIYDVMKIRPAIYLNGNYAQNVLGQATATLRNQLAQPSGIAMNFATPAFTQVWSARYPNQADPNSIPVQTGHPSDTFAGAYGPWDDYGTTHPWQFWQYASTGRLSSFNGGSTDIDVNVLQGGTEYLKDQLIPAVWWTDTGGDWSSLGNWNSGQTPITPISSPGQLAPIGTQTLPTPRLPGAAGSGPTSGQHDTVVLDRPSAAITVTLSTGTHNVRKIYVRETLNITGGSLTVNYVPVAESTAMSAQFSAAVSISGNASLSAHTIHVDAANDVTAGNANLTFDMLMLGRGTTPARLFVNGDLTVTGTAGGSAKVGTNLGTAATGFVDLAGGNRTLTVTNGAANHDLAIAVPIANGGLAKSGPGTMALSSVSTYTGPTDINQGRLWVSGTLGNTAIAVNTGAVFGGTGQIGGSITVAGGSSASTRGTIDLADNAIGTLRFTSSNAAATAVTLGGATANPSSLLFEVGSSADRIQIDAGKIAIQPGGAVVGITALPGFGYGTYDLITFQSGQATGLEFASLSSNTLNGYSMSLQSTPTSLQLVVVPEPAMVGAVLGLVLLANRRRIY
jgi:autotransporter-associated beta strand protein